jgi:beta-phosphoglucomutase-like phosphatase (HAD superfamily)
MLRAAHGSLSQVGIVPHEVTIKADGPCLRAGTPASDPFLLADKCLGYRVSRCVVFEYSPSGIKAGVAAGAFVIAVGKSHTRGKIDECGPAFHGGELGRCALRGD